MMTKLPNIQKLAKYAVFHDSKFVVFLESVANFFLPK